MESSYPALEAFLNKTENDIFSLIPEREKDYNLTKDEYLAMRRNDRNVLIKPADKESSIVEWDRVDYLAEAEKQPSETKTCKEVQLSEKGQIKIVGKSNSMFKEL